MGGPALAVSWTYERDFLAQGGGEGSQAARLGHSHRPDYLRAHLQVLKMPLNASIVCVCVCARVR